MVLTYCCRIGNPEESGVHSGMPAKGDMKIHKKIQRKAVNVFVWATVTIFKFKLNIIPLCL